MCDNCRCFWLLTNFPLCLSLRYWSTLRPCTMEAGSVVRAVFDFCPSVSEELPLFVGDVIEVRSVVDEFWLLGKKEGVTGKSWKCLHLDP